MTTSAINYVARACAGLEEFKVLASMNPANAFDVSLIEEHIKRMETAQHFVMPDGGRIVDDDFRSVSGIDLKLPFKSMTIEYYMPQDGSVGTSTRDNDPCPRRVALVNEHSVRDMRNLFHQPKMFSEMDDDGSVMSVLCVFEINGRWILHPIVGIVPLGYAYRRPNYEIAITPAPSLLMFVPAIDKAVAEGNTSLMVDIAEEAVVVIDFVEAMMCSNVGRERMQTAVPSHKRKNKLPLYDYWELVIKQRDSDRGVGCNGGEHTSPRQHVRRGHIRRLSGGRLVWVSSCVVGSHGRIEKTYVAVA